jgi:hypothetical protein
VFFFHSRTQTIPLLFSGILAKIPIQLIENLNFIRKESEEVDLTPLVDPMETGIKIQVALSKLEDWARNNGGESLRLLCVSHTKLIKQSTTLYLADASSMQPKDIVALCPDLNIAQVCKFTFCLPFSFLLLFYLFL